MDNEKLFWLSHAVVYVGWIALLLAPWRRGLCINIARGVALILAVSYGIQLLTNTVSVEGASFTTLAGITAMFSIPANVMLGWTHYLVFDLFIGSWEAEDAPQSGVPHWILIPCLFFTFLLGPVGLLLYFIARTVCRKRLSA
jgi:hypothetical protein